MYVQKRGDKYRFFEKFKNYRTGKYMTVSVTMDRNTNATRIAAATALKEKIALAQEAPENTAELTLAGLVDAYRSYQQHSVKSQTYKRDYYATKALLKLLGDNTLVHNLDASYVKDKLLKSGKKNGTLNGYIKRFKALIRWGYMNDLVYDKAFLDKIRPFPDTSYREKIENKFLEHDELDLLLNNLEDPKWNMLVRFMTLSGMRFGEVAALEKSDIDLKNKYIHVTKSFEVVTKNTGTTKTHSSMRDVYIQKELYTLIKKEILPYFKKQEIQNHYLTPLLFSDPDGQNIQIAAFNKYIRKHNPTNKNITSHIFRHTHTALLAEQHVPLDTISRRLGHTNSKITKDVYFHITKKIRENDNLSIKNIRLITN